LVPTSSLAAAPAAAFTGGETGTVLGLVGKSDPLDSGEGLTLSNPQFSRVTRGTITATVELEGRAAPLGSGVHSTLLDVHLRLPGSAIDVSDAIFRSANDDYATTTDTVEVQTTAAGALTLTSVPPGRYVLTVKDTSHVSGRTDTITVRAGQTVAISSGAGNGFFGSDLRGDPTMLLPSSGRQLVAGDVSQDNEINEDDVNLIIAAWGTNSSKPFFAQADLNNDAAVGAADLTATTSNFGNSEGFGAPPVYRPVVTGDNGRTAIELIPELPAGRTPRPGDRIAVEVLARDLEDLAGYELALRYDPASVRPVEAGVTAGEVFAPNKQGAVFSQRLEPGEVRVIGARIGRAWSARGDGVLARVAFELLDATGLSTVRGGDGLLLTSRYAGAPVHWGKTLAEHLLPSAPGLSQNYPNPFNPTTVIPFALTEAGPARLAIYDLLGQRVRLLGSGLLPAGYHSLVWDGRDEEGAPVAAGVYLYQLEAGGLRQTRKMVLVK
jgi:hypothetical protein